MSRQRTVGHTYERQEEWRNEDQPTNLAMGVRSDAEGSKEPGSARENPNNETDSGNTMQPTKNAIESDKLKEMEVDGNIQKGSGETASASAEKTLNLNGSKEKRMDTLPNEGRGDPTSTMLWSPRKHAGQKKPLEAEEAMLEGS